MNRKQEAPSNASYMQKIPIDSFDWNFSEDDSVDLAVAAFGPPPTAWDYLTISIDMFATQEMIEDGEIVEGDPVIFSGLFIQYAGQTKLEPVVRSGTLAMLPTGTIETSLRKQGRVYLADAHVFGGNSGSPMMVDILKFRTGLGSSYKLLGIVSAEVFETKELTIQTTTDFKATEYANSDVSMVVPAQELRKILFNPTFLAQRESVIQQTNKKQQ